MYQDQMQNSKYIWSIFVISARVIPLKNYTPTHFHFTIVPRFQWSYLLLWTCSVGCDPVFDVNASITRMVYTLNFMDSCYSQGKAGWFSTQYTLPFTNAADQCCSSLWICFTDSNPFILGRFSHGTPVSSNFWTAFSLAIKNSPHPRAIGELLE